MWRDTADGPGLLQGSVSKAQSVPPPATTQSQAGTVRGKKNRTGTITASSTAAPSSPPPAVPALATSQAASALATQPHQQNMHDAKDVVMHLVPSSNAAGAAPASGGPPSAIDNDENSRDTFAHSARDRDDGSTCSIDYADPDASIRPITPSSIDAASSFTGSTSLHSMAPTSRTFKSFVTGHSKTSASTKPTTQFSGASAAQQTVSHASAGHNRRQSAEGNAIGTGIGMASGAMREGGANRIATSIHDVEARSAPLQKGDGPNSVDFANPGVNSAGLAENGSKLSVPRKKTSFSEQAYAEDGSVHTPAKGNMDRDHQPSNEHGDRTRSMEHSQQQSGEDVLPSSSSITFSKLPPTSPAAAYAQSSPSSPFVYPSNASISSSHISHDASNAMNHYPRHSHPDPKNNPRASSPPPDNASILTLASSTGGGERDERNGGPSSLRQEPSGSLIRGGGEDRPDQPKRTRSGKFSFVSTMTGENGRLGGGGANEDASIRAIAPSRRESGDSLNSRWSAAVLSSHTNNQQAQPSHHARSQLASSVLSGTTDEDDAYHSVNDKPTSLAGDPQDTYAGRHSSSIRGGGADSASVRSSRRGTPSVRTTATGRSSYYAAPMHQVEVR